jgi:Repeat of unknown function (DUF6923)
MDAVTHTVCEAILVRSGEHGGGTTLSRVDLPSGTEVRLNAVGYDLNAIGYAASQDVVYGIGHHGHLIRITRSGDTTDLGFVRGVPRGDLALATAGAVVGGNLVVREDDRLFSIDITPSSRTFQTVVHIVRLRPEADGLDDFAVDPVDGLLYGISTTPFDRPAVVSVDPNSGAVHRVATPAGLPHGASHGAVVIDPARTMYVVNNEVGGRSRLYSVPYGEAATELASGPADDSTDAAGCLGVPTPPPPPPPPPLPPSPATTTPPPPPVVTTPPSPQPPAPTTPAPAVVPPRPPQSQRPVTTTTKHSSAPAAAPVVAPMSDEKTQQRHWALATVLLIVGGGAAAAGTRRARAR